MRPHSADRSIRPGLRGISVTSVPICQLVKLFLFCTLIASWPLALYSDEPVRSVQEELRRRNIYFGDVDGRRTPEFEEAVKRYQRRKGLPSSGSEDRETLRSLKLLAREPGEAPPRELAWPDEPVLKSDAKINVAEEAERISEETGVASESVAPMLAAEPSKKPTSRRRQNAGSSRSRTASGSGGGSPAGHRAGVARDEKFTPEELFTFVSDYLRALSKRDPQGELRFYADRVEYFHNGSVDRRIVERTLRDYYKQWPKRSFALGTPVQYRPDPTRGEIVISFQVNFTLKGTRGSVRGRTENEIVINAATADPRIVKIQERRLRS